MTVGRVARASGGRGARAVPEPQAELLRRAWGDRRAASGHRRHLRLGRRRARARLLRSRGGHLLGHGGAGRPGRPRDRYGAELPVDGVGADRHRRRRDRRRCSTRERLGPRPRGPRVAAPAEHAAGRRELPQQPDRRDRQTKPRSAGWSSSATSAASGSSATRSTAASRSRPGAALPQAADISPTALSLNVMSKAYGLSGLRIGWLASRTGTCWRAPREPQALHEICNAGPSEHAGDDRAAQRREVRARNRAIISENLPLFRAFFAERWSDLFEWEQPQGGCVSFPRYSRAGGRRGLLPQLLAGGRASACCRPASTSPRSPRCRPTGSAWGSATACRAPRSRSSTTTLRGGRPRDEPEGGTMSATPDAPHHERVETRMEHVPEATGSRAASGSSTNRRSAT